MWTIEHSSVTTATPNAIWRLWSDVSVWPTWDEEFERVDLDGEFAVGTGGALHMPEMPPIPFTLTVVEPDVAFEDVSPFGNANLRFYHRLDSVEGGTRITHGAEITGEGGPAIAMAIGENLAHGMVRAVAKLAELAEAGT